MMVVEKLKTFCLGSLTAAIVAFPSLAEDTLPDMGSSASRVMSIQDEQDLGMKVMMQIRRSMPLVDDPEITDYVQHLGYRLVAQNEDSIYREFRFFVVADPSINAFALPGGYIGLHTGLIMASESEHELAGVLAHEIAHVTQRHIARRAELSKQLSLPTLASMIGSILLAVRNSQAGLAALAATQAGNAQAIINHTRSNESEADRIGIKMLEDAGFDPVGMVTFFEKMQKAAMYSRRPPEFLSTHPLSRSRVADARARATEKRTPYIATSLSYQLTKAKLSSLLTSRRHEQHKALIEAEKELELRPTDYNRYAYALALLENDKSDQAEPIIAKLLKESPQNIAYLLAMVRIRNHNDEHDKAITLLKRGLDNYPRNHALTMSLAETYMEAKQPGETRKILLKHIHSHKESHTMYQLLARAQRSAGYISEAHESQGQYLYLLGDVIGAKAEFERALRRKTKDPYLDARIGARIDELDRLIAEIRAQQRGRRR